MFRKQDDRLRQLNEELLAEEEDYEAYEEYEEDELDEDAIAELLGEEADEQEEAEPFYRNHANGYGKEIRNYANRYGKGSPTRFDDEDFDEEELEDEEFLYREDFRKASKKKKKAERAQRKERRKKLGLAIIALVELIAIGGILAWWISWML